MRVVPLGSGSRGNAFLVETAATRILVDAGLSARALGERLQSIGVEPAGVDAILLSHEHHDHARGAERFSRVHRVPVFSSRETLEALDRSPVHFAGWHALPESTPVPVGDVRVDAFPVPHDAARPVGFVLEGSDGTRVGIVTDLGHATRLVVERLRGCHVLVVEANHDEAMLRDGPYPWHLKQRVGSRMGHLSNAAAAALIETVAGPDCRAVVLAHLSEKNNRPDLARQAAGRALERAGCRRVEMRVARATRPTAEVRI